MGTIVFVKFFILCVVMKLTDGQNLSAARMTEIFRTSKANDADIAELLTNVNFEETAEGKQKAAIQWIRQKLTARDLKKGYLRNVERYGNDVWCALARLWVETFSATPSYSKRSQVLEKALTPYPPKRTDFYRWKYLKDVRDAFKALAWRKMYQNVGFEESDKSHLDKLFRIARKLQMEKFGF